MDSCGQKSKVQKIEVETSDWKEDVQGLPGEEMMLQLILRVVADVGFVGLPNAGKSSLLASLSRARPEIAPYPFTTLIPNLGVMGCGGDPVLVDLPGLIEGAHVGRGLGRNFLRHLRRTRMLLQVIDASLPDPVTDYETIREELRMYNPQYCERLHLVALNKIDLVQSPERLGEMMDGIRGVAQNLRGRCPSASVPSHIILTNALEGTGADEVQRAIEEALRDGRVEETGWGEWDE